MPHGPDSIENVYLDYLDRSQQYSAQFESGQFLPPPEGEEFGPFPPLSETTPSGPVSVATSPEQIAANLDVQVAEARERLITPPEKIPPLPRNLTELSTFTRFSEPQIMESFGATGRTGKTIDTALAAINAPFEGLYNLILQVPAQTDEQKMTRELVAKLAYIGSMFAPVDLGLTKGVKALNVAARGTKLESQVVGRTAEIAGGARPAPATFAHVQEGFGNVPAFSQFTLTEDIPGHIKGSTVSDKTLREAGFEVPPVPESVGAAAAAPEALAPAAKGQIKLGRNAVGEGERGFISRTGEDIVASPEGHQFTDAPTGALRYRLLESPDSSRAFFDIPWVLSPQQFSLILRRSRGMDEIILDTVEGPMRTSSIHELRETLLPFVEKESFELAPLIAKTHAEFGGSTFNFTGQNLANTEGYAVSTMKNLEKVLDHAPTEADVKAYIDGLPDVLTEQLKNKRGNWPRLNIGTWEDAGKHYLDVSQVEPNFDRAMTLAVDNKQKAIFDLKKMESISVEKQGFLAPEPPAKGTLGRVSAETPRLPGEQRSAPGELIVPPPATPPGSVGAAVAGELSSSPGIGTLAAGTLPSPNEIKVMYGAGKDIQDWYEGAYPALQKAFGDRAETVAKISSAVSVSQDPLDEVRITLKILKALEGKDLSKMSEKAVKKIVYESGGGMFTRAMAPNVYRAIRGEDLSGLKIPEYLKAKMGDPNAVAFDTWMGRAMNLSPKSEAQVKVGIDTIRSSARQLGVTPVQLQASMWGAVKILMDTNVQRKLAAGKSLREILPKWADVLEQGIQEAERIGFLKRTNSGEGRVILGLTVAGLTGLLTPEDFVDLDNQTEIPRRINLIRGDDGRISGFDILKEE